MKTLINVAAAILAASVLAVLTWTLFGDEIRAFLEAPSVLHDRMDAHEDGHL